MIRKRKPGKEGDVIVLKSVCVTPNSRSVRVTSTWSPHAFPKHSHLAQIREFYFSSSKHMVCVSSIPCIFTVKPYSLPFDVFVFLSTFVHYIHVFFFLSFFDLVWDLNITDHLHFKQCHPGSVYLFKFMYNQKTYVFGVSFLCDRCMFGCGHFQSPSVSSWVAEP